MGLIGAILQKTYGPFELIGEQSGEGRVFLSLPFTDVVGCRLMISLADNYGSILPQTGIPIAPNFLWPGVEMTIWGVVQSYESCVKRMHLHALSGPMATQFRYEDGWDQITLRARNTNGGSYVNLKSGGGPPLFPTQANGYSLKATVLVMPRTGFPTPGQNNGPRAG